MREMQDVSRKGGLAEEAAKGKTITHRQSGGRGGQGMLATTSTSAEISYSFHFRQDPQPT